LRLLLLVNALTIQIFQSVNILITSGDVVEMYYLFVKSQPDIYILYLERQVVYVQTTAVYPDSEHYCKLIFS
jgi:hypothetical protein